MSEKAPRLLTAHAWCIAIRAGFRRDGRWYMRIYQLHHSRSAAIAAFEETWKDSEPRRTFAKCRKAGVAKAVRVKITAEVPE